MKRLSVVLSVAAIAFCVGCISPLFPYNSPSIERLQILATAPQDYVLAINHQTLPIPQNGKMTLSIPSFERRHKLILFGVTVYNRSAEDRAALYIWKGEKRVRKITLSQLAKLPKTPDQEILIDLRSATANDGAEQRRNG